MKYGLNEENYEKIKNIINKYQNYKFKIFGSRARGEYKENSDIDIAIFEDVQKEDEYKIMDEEKSREVYREIKNTYLKLLLDLNEKFEKI